MVSQEGSARTRLLQAAAAEFAARGFDGATVDRIAARARVNKALVYYYFHSKTSLYMAILRDVFGAVAAAVIRVRDAGGPPDTQVAEFVQALAQQALSRPHFPAIWLREMADGGRHLDRTVAVELRRVIETLAAMLNDGHRAGTFRTADPFLIHLSIVSPLLLFLASAPLRTRLKNDIPASVARVAPAAMVQHLQRSVLAMLAPNARRRSS